MNSFGSKNVSGRTKSLSFELARSMTADDSGSFSDAVFSKFGVSARRLTCLHAGPVIILATGVTSAARDCFFEDDTVAFNAPGRVQGSEFRNAYLLVNAQSAIQVFEVGFSRLIQPKSASTQIRAARTARTSATPIAPMPRNTAVKNRT